jgi:ATP-binding cassette subfamily B protein
MVIATAALTAYIPVVFKYVIDSLGGSHGTPASSLSVLLIGVYVLAQLTTRALGEWRSLATGFAAQRLNRHLSQRLYDHVMSLTLAYHLERKTGAIGETLSQGLSGCQMVLQQLVLTVIPTLVQFVAMIWVLAHFQHLAYLGILVVSATAYYFVFQYGASRVSRPAREASSAHIDAHAVLTDGLLNFESIKYFTAEKVVSVRYASALAAAEVAWRQLLKSKLWSSLAVASIFSLSLGATLLAASREVLSGTMTVGDFIMISTYAVQLFAPLEAMGFAARDIAQGLSFIEKMLSIYAERPERLSRSTKATWKSFCGSLQFDQVHLSYGPGRVVLRGASFSVPAGTTTALVGASGAGKSSMVRLLFRLYEPESGRILIDGMPISGLSLDELRGGIAIVPQDTVLFNDSIAANIRFGKPDASLDEIHHAARMAHLDKLIDSLPEGYDTVVGERGLKLSGGEKQRVAIARAAIKRPAIFVFDEATSSLDSKTEQDILRNLFEVSRNHTTLLIAHRLSTVIHADQIVVLDHGVAVERGRHTELLNRGGLYAALWKAQHGWSHDTETTPDSRIQYSSG